ncbi:MAG: phage tail domain-containing protein, partial [Candidatus Komeilibacteria bacterium]
MADSTYYAWPVNAPVSFRIQGRDLRELGFESTEYPNLLLPPSRTRHQVIEGYAGSIDHGQVFDNWTFTLTGRLMGLDHYDLIDKKTKLLRWISPEQHHQAEWLVSQYGVNALKFECAGDRNFYEEGTITTNGTATITGSGTYWKSYVVPGAEFRIQGMPATGGLSTRYTVLRVDSDTSITLTAATTSSSAGLTYQVERKRYLLVNYGGSSDINSSGLGPAQRTKVLNLSISFTTNFPYWIGDEFTFEQDSAQYFQVLRGVGTAPFGPTYQLVGASTNPEICACELAFNARFDGDTKARAVLNKADVTGTLTEGVVYRAGKLGTGQAIEIYGDGTRGRGDEVYFFSKTDESDPGANEAPVFGAANRINYNQGSLSMWICTSWDGDDGVLHDIFKSYVDANSQIYLYKTAANLLVLDVNDQSCQSADAL